MKLLSVFILLIALKETTEIIQGFIARKKEWPSLVQIYYRITWHCSGTVLTSNFVLTSAKCIDPSVIGVTGLLGIKLGPWDDLGYTDRILVSYQKIWLHPDYLEHRDSGATIHDIGLIKLNGFIAFTADVHPVSISFQSRSINMTCHTAGWGANSISIYDEPYPQTASSWSVSYLKYLRQIPQIVVFTDYCQRPYPMEWRGAINKKFHVCTRTSYSEVWARTGPTFGDYGGPLICNGEQMAILSFSNYYEPNWPYHMAVWTPLSNYENWMKDTIKEAVLPDIQLMDEKLDTMDPHDHNLLDHHWDVGSLAKPGPVIFILLTIAQYVFI